MATTYRTSIGLALTAGSLVLLLLNALVITPLAMSTAPGSHTWHLDCSCGCDAATVTCCCTTMSDQVEVRGCGTTTETAALQAGLLGLLPQPVSDITLPTPRDCRRSLPACRALPEVPRAIDRPPPPALL